MTLIIELVGEQYIPNVLPIKHIQPEKVYLIYTDRTSKQYQRLVQLLQKTTIVEGIESDAYDIPAITGKLDAALQQYRTSMNLELIFNLTGGTKAMVLAAYQLAAEYNALICYLQSEGTQSILYRYDWQNQYLNHPLKECISECLTLHEILNLHLGQGTHLWNIEGPSEEDGGRFERAIADVLIKNDYEVISGVKLLNQVEIDVMIRYQNQLGIIEAKTGRKAGQLEGVQQLSRRPKITPTCLLEVLRDGLRDMPDLFVVVD